MPLSDAAQFEVERAVERVIIKLWAGMDAGEFHTVIDSFADDGVWHRQGKELKGPSQVRAAMEERPKAARTRHVVTNMLVDVLDDTRADLQCYLTVWQHMAPSADAPPPAPMNVPLTVALSKARLSRTASGWKITELKSADTFRRQ